MKKYLPVMKPMMVRALRVTQKYFFWLGVLLMFSPLSLLYAESISRQTRVQQLSSPVGQSETVILVQDKFDLRQYLVQNSHYQESEIEIEIGLHLISLNVVNSRSNAFTRKQREQDATLLASTLEKAIKADHQFADINAIHINYVRRNKQSLKLIQGFDFFQTKAGAFILNKS
ncbi:hypothetical protein H8K35_09540 [Undibacterium sp. LX40W]|uniref:Uncharacterized protein n=1 Tax=Undibacterium nitidum TaxID=2762298 RepID=A0A923HU85_9BURK|nr:MULTISPECIES: hypothetical protein [Undibacterium]MBC3881319.1 hypothetical protein [Undibacterium nitidum]MBC3891898.1 hypothetical protein [Undibacterium sp. LX40W]